MKVLVVGTGAAHRGSGVTTAADQVAAVVAGLGHEAVRVEVDGRRRRRPNRMNVENVVAVVADTRRVFRGARRADADVVWIHTVGMPLLPAGRTLLQLVAARLARRPAIVHFHGFGLEDHLAAGPGRLERSVLRLIGRCSTRLVALHEPAAAALADVTGAEVVVLPNWVDVPDRAEPLPPAPPFTVVFVGGLVARKGITVLLDAIRLLGDRPVQLRVVGGPGADGPEAAAAIEAAARDLVDAGTVRFAGEVGPAQVRDELRAAHLFALPSSAEGTPMAMLEAMAEGRPVLVSAAGNAGELVAAAGCGVVLDAIDPGEVADRIRGLVDDQAALAVMATNAHAAARAEHSATAAEPAVEKLLASTLALAGRR